MELEQLRIFAAVAESKSFTKAAKKLFISHSSTSRAVKALEDELGVRLFERENKIFGLTEKGKALYEGAKKLLSEAEELKKEIEENNRG